MFVRTAALTPRCRRMFRNMVPRLAVTEPARCVSGANEFRWGIGEALVFG